MNHGCKSGWLNLSFIGIDPVELAPDRDHPDTATTLAAKALRTTIGRIAHRAKG